MGLSLLKLNIVMDFIANNSSLISVKLIFIAAVF